MIEVEVKVKVADLGATLGRLSKLREVGRYEEEDIYWDDALGTLRKRGVVLKLRRRDGTCSLIFKGRRLKCDCKAREEVEVRVDDAKGMEKILSEIGFKPSFKVFKVRREYVSPHGRVFLDEVRGAGSFMELEAVGRELSEARVRLRRLMEEVGVKEEDVITKAYPEILEKH